jgi:hypothetical protein
MRLLCAFADVSWVKPTPVGLSWVNPLINFFFLKKKKKLESTLHIDPAVVGAQPPDLLRELEPDSTPPECFFVV